MFQSVHQRLEKKAGQIIYKLKDSVKVPIMLWQNRFEFSTDASICRNSIIVEDDK